MKPRGEVWRQRLWIWVPALIFFLANAAGFAVYRLGYSGRVASLQNRLEVQEQTLRDLENRKMELQTQLTRVSTNELQVQQLYAERLSTRSQRLTSVTAEVKSLASRAGLEPKSFSYPEEEIDSYGLIQRSFIFPVEGTYPELRQFLNLLEASRSFITVEEIKLGGDADEGAELRIELSLSTLFARDPEDAVAAPPQSGEGGTS